MSIRPAGAHNGVMSTATDTLRQMWDTRPPRIPSEQGGNAKIAGVCEGIGVRYQIDPTLVRVAFVVSALTLGGGLAAYLLAWGFMPRYGMSVSPLQAITRRAEQLSEPEAGQRTTGWVLLVFLILFLTSSVPGDGVILSSAFGSIILMLAAWWALDKRTPAPPAGLLATPPTATMTQPVDLSMFTPAEGTPVPPGRTTPPAWDPLGAAPFAWDLPEPGPAPQPKRRARIWPWILGGISVALAISAAITALFGAMVVNDPDIAQPKQYAPAAEAELQSSYEGEIGDLVVDLRNLPALEKSHEISVEGGIGPVNIFLPREVPLTIECDAGLGESDCEPGEYNPDAEGERLTLNVEGGIGPVRVMEGE